MNRPEEWFLDVPPITRTYVTASVLLSLAVQINLVSPFQLYFNFSTAFGKKQYWRLLTTFLYFGPLSFDLVFHLFFMARYSRMLEESSFRGRTADFFWLIFLSAFALICISPFVAMPFLGSPLAFTLVYIWARREPYIRLNFLGLFTFHAPYLPWVLLAFAMLINPHSLPVGDLMGIAVGHLYYFFEDVWPRQSITEVKIVPTNQINTYRKPRVEIEVLEETEGEQDDNEDQGPKSKIRITTYRKRWLKTPGLVTRLIEG